VLSVIGGLKLGWWEAKDTDTVAALIVLRQPRVRLLEVAVAGSSQQSIRSRQFRPGDVAGEAADDIDKRGAGGFTAQLEIV
jgi:hypothetical protein